MAQRLRLLLVLSEDPALFPASTWGTSQLPVTLILGDSIPSPGFCGHSNTHAHAHTHTTTTITTNNKNKNNNNNNKPRNTETVKRIHSRTPSVVIKFLNGIPPAEETVPTDRCSYMKLTSSWTARETISVINR